ncbi:uncharacterized protein LOC134224762 isoform X1 [Armigeres subalbatus]|uniref:uncharacterized protein LOC134224762 isoform X1 n=1 Tax=Armigeres subalbatus TaxID=124917 RepID=UPI002ED47461
MISNSSSKNDKSKVATEKPKCDKAETTSTKSKERPYKLRHIRSFSRDYQQMSHIPLYCYLCRLQCKDDNRFAKHMTKHGRIFGFIRQVDDYLLEESSFTVRLDYRPDYARTLVYVRNVSPHSVLRLSRAYIHLADGHMKMLIESEMRLPWGTVSKFCFDSCLLSELDRSYGLILVGLADSKTEILELYHLQVTVLSHFVKEQLILKKPTIHCPLLNQYPVPMEKKIIYESFQWFNKYVATNHEQLSAVRNIVNRTSFPAPYILFGPPGTEKTSTIVEAVLQI